MFKRKENDESQTEEKSKSEVKSKGLISFGMKALLYTTITLGAIGILDHYNVPSRLLGTYQKIKESAIERTIKADDSIVYNSFDQYLSTVPDSMRADIMGNYLSAHPETFGFFLKNQKVDSLLKADYNGVARSDDKLEYILESGIGQDEKTSLTIGIYKTLDNTHKWKVAKDITKDTFGL